MIVKCPNCQMENMEGSLFCDGCAWDLMGVEATPGEAAPAPVAAAPAAEAMPAEAMPAEAMAVDAAMAAPMAEIPMAGPVSQVRQPTGTRQPTAAKPVTAAQAAIPVSQVRQPTAAKPVTAAPPAPVSQLRQPTAARPVTAAPPAPVSQVRQPTAAKPASMLGGGAPAAMPKPASPTVARLHPEAVAKLVVVRGLKTGIEYPVYEGANFIGRFDEKPVDIDLTGQEEKDNIWVGRQHACVTWENGGLVIEDLTSQNGTFVNRKKLTPGEKTSLKERDIVQVGTVQFAVKL